jgi:hypothetical protein
VKRTPLKRGEPLKRGGPLKRKTRLVQMSKKRRAISGQRARMVRDELQRRPNCEAGPMIWLHRSTIYRIDSKALMDRDLGNGCVGYSCELHEPLTRARGGSILDPENTVAICRVCHDWVHAHPVAAQAIGLLVSQHTNEETQ